MSAKYRGGVEPFPEIRKCVDALKPDGGLVVVAPTLETLLTEGGNSSDNPSATRHELRPEKDS